MSEHKKNSDEFIPWENEEGRTRKPKRGDSIPPKTNIQSRVHSKPKTEGQDYLDMYIRSKEKERTEKYGGILAEQLKDIAETWRDIKKEMRQKEKGMPKVPEGGIEESDEEVNKEAKRKKPPGHMKRMDWNY